MQKAIIAALFVVISAITGYSWWSVYDLANNADSVSSVKNCNGSGVCEYHYTTYNNDGNLVTKVETVWVGKY